MADALAVAAYMYTVRLEAGGRLYTQVENPWCGQELL